MRERERQKERDEKNLYFIGFTLWRIYMKKF